MFGKKKSTAPVGALEKMAVAQRLREKSRAETQHRGGKGQSYSQTIPVTIIFVLAVALAMMLTDGNSMLSGLHPTGIYTLDSILTGSKIPSLMGDPDLDRLIVILIRGAAFFLATGLIPLAALMVMRMSSGRLSPLIACWGAIIILPPLLYFMKSGILPILSDLIQGF